MAVSNENPTISPQGGSAALSARVVIAQAVAADAQALAGFFRGRQQQVWHTPEAHTALELVLRHQATLLFMDMHLPGGDWLEVLRAVQKQSPATHIVVTNKHPDLRREIMARDAGLVVFLRYPFTRQWVDRALARSGTATAPMPLRPSPVAVRLPRVKFPVSLKITLPYVLLALAFAAGAGYLLSRYVLESFQERFTAQLVDAGTLAADWMVQEEERRLATLRLIARTQGLAEAIAADNAESLRALALPVVVNNREEAVEILNVVGHSVLALRHVPGGSVEAYTASRGDAVYGHWPLVLNVLGRQVDDQGDKFAGLVSAAWGDYFYVAGPVIAADNTLAGVVLVGASLPTIARGVRETTLAQATLYDSAGRPLDSTLPTLAALPLSADQALSVLARQDAASLVRDLQVASASYTEIIGPWEARSGQDLGLIGVALPRTALARPTAVTQLQAFGLLTAALLLILALGAFLARRITQPLTQMVQASAQVAQGNLEVKVDTTGDDEVAVLAHAFNYMVTGLQEGYIYRDLLGRTVSPEVREQLRQGFASGDLRLEGQNVVATVLMSDIRGFTTLAERESPTTVLAWLNEYFSTLVPHITAQGGVIDKFEGDALLAFFGILPRPLTPKESAYQACRAALGMLARVEQINAHRVLNSQPPFVTGIGLNTGLVTAGGLGAAERLNYTVIGDTVNTVQRLEGLTRDFGASGIVVSETTVQALADRAGEFQFEPLGSQAFRGKREAVRVFRLRGLGLALPGDRA
ncbi:MAG: HAMP domain-containing protein [Anaerolineales bacterium]|nr:HAMP domain-containing protein [Anaerolineales bacterium]